MSKKPAVDESSDPPSPMNDHGPIAIGKDHQ